MYSRKTHILLLLAIALLQFGRQPGPLLHPTLFREDAGVLFEHFYNRLPGSPWLLYYQGYVSVGPNLLAWLASQVPTVWVGQSFSLVALLVHSSCASVFFLTRFRVVLPDDRARFVVCLLQVALPLGNGFLVTALTWSCWPMLLASTLLCLVPPERPRWSWTSFEFLFLGVAVCSSPLSIVLLPVLAQRVARAAPALRAGYLVLGAMVVGYAITMRGGFLPTGWVTTVTGGPDDGRDAARDGLWATLHTFPAMFDRVVFESLLTNRVRSALIDAGWHWLVVAVGGVLLVLTVRSVRRTPALLARYRAAASVWIGAGYLALAITWVSLFARFGPAGLDYRAFFHHRYFWVQQYLSVLALAVAAVFWWERLGTRARRVAVTCGCVLLVAENLLDRAEFGYDRERGLQLEQFLQRVAAGERGTGAGVTLPIEFGAPGDPGWMTLRIERWR